MPDLNSVPPSPRVLAASRQSSFTSVSGIAAASTNNNTGSTSTTSAPMSALTSAPTSVPSAATPMPPPPVPTSPSSIHVFPSNQMAVNHGGTALSSSLPSPYFPPPMPLGIGVPAAPGDGPGVGPGPGPLRHPRPLTAAELHMQLEKEQEAVVNRLTRELTLLRAQNASVVSNTSSTSAGGGSDAAVAGPSSGPSSGPGEHALFSGTTGFSIPSSTGRHNRTYSNTSTRSQTAAAGSTPSVVGITAPAPIRPSAPGLSRQNSTHSRRSRANSPGPQSLPHSYTHSHMGDAASMANYFQQQQQQQQSPYYARGVSGSSTTPSASDISPAILPGTARYEETAFYRAELESVKRENEALKRRIRELERAAAASTASASASNQPTENQQQQQHHHHHHRHRERRERRSSDASRGRSESVSTTASMSVAPASSSASLSALAAAAASPSSSGPPSATIPPSGTAPEPATGVGGVGIAGRRETGRERVTSMLSVAGSVGVGVPEDEVRVGESAASAGLRAQDSSSIGGGSGVSGP